MFAAESSQRHISQTLNAAFANGLLSEDTFLRRTDQLLEGGMIDPARLVGDINLRRSRTSLADMAATVARWALRISGSAEPARPLDCPLLALDWSGAGTEVLIGRHHRCDVVLADLSVSRLHARLVFRDEKWILQDLGSTNGTVVNGSDVGRCELRPGDLLAIGDQHVRID